MRVALPFHRGDIDQARRWLAWVTEIVGGAKHDLFLMPAKGEPMLPATGWKSVTMVPDTEGETSEWSKAGEVRSASGPNSSFRQFARYFYYENKGYYLWMEPDAILLVPDGFDRLEAEYLKSGKKFMGVTVNVSNVPRHSSGIGIYHEDTALIQSLMLPGTAMIQGQRVEIAFDVAGANDVLSSHHETKLIQHVFRGPEFTSREQFERDVSKEAVIFHTDKTGSLLPFLRETLSGGVESRNANGDAMRHESGDAIRPQEPRNRSRAERSEAISGTNAPPAQNVYTYFSPGAGEFLVEQRKLLKLWEQSWRAHGWTPIILTEHDAQKHPHFTQIKKAFAKLPTANPKAYEMACWLRHVAMVVVDGGVLTDYDTINNGFTSEDVPELPKWSLRQGAVMPTCLFKGVPCAIAGTGTAFCDAVQYFEEADERFIERGKPHVSDMHLIQKWKWHCEDIGKEYGSNGWNGAKLIHFGHYSCAPKLRSEVIGRFLASLEPVEYWSESVPISKETEARLLTTSMNAAPSIVGQIREHLTAIQVVVGENLGRKAVFRTELRRAGFIGAAKRRK